MVADRVDAPPGWRGNAPTMWFIEQARARGLIPELRLDLPDHPSSISAGGVLVRQGVTGPEALLIRVGERSFELPKGRIEWDELPGEAAVRECQEEAGIESPLRTGDILSAFEYPFTKHHVTFLKRVVYFRLEALGPLVLGALPEGTREILWVNRETLGSVPLRKGELRPVIEAALG
jgi:8-oxo-dGTP pyrophosphatase MutT (NUDIX family)